MSPEPKAQKVDHMQPIAEGVWAAARAAFMESRGLYDVVVQVIVIK